MAGPGRRIRFDAWRSKKHGARGPVEVPEIISILPLRNSVLFPGSIIPIDVGRKKSVKLVEEAISKERPVIGIVTQRDARTEDPAAATCTPSGAPRASSRSSSSPRTTSR